MVVLKKIKYALVLAVMVIGFSCNSENIEPKQTNGGPQPIIIGAPGDD